MASSRPNPEQRKAAKEKRELIVLALSMGLAAACGLLYQLILGALSTYLVGNSVYQYSVTIGFFMFSYGVGSWLSGWVKTNLLLVFVATELALGIIGGCSALLLTLAYAEGPFFELTRVLLILSVGAMVGIEVPLLVRLFEERQKNLRVSLAHLMSVDYIGALIAGLAFPLILLPWLGLLGASLVTGLLNLLIAILIARLILKDYVSTGPMRVLYGVGGSGILGFILLLANLSPIEWMIENQFYNDRVVYLEQSPYQRIVLTRHKDDLRLYLDGSLQLSSKDEYRYHESLIHPGAARVKQLERVLILGGGDGLALRELLKYPSIKSIDLVDLDPRMVQLARSKEALRSLNQNSFDDIRVKVHHADAYSWVAEGDMHYDYIVVDLPDPHHVELAKLYSKSFYSNLKERLNEEGVMVVQCGSPMFSNTSYWMNHKTIESASLNTLPFHVNVPSFGEWGFVMATKNEKVLDRILPDTFDLNLRVGNNDLRFYSSLMDSALTTWPQDLKAKSQNIEVTTLLHPRVAYAFEKDWREWN